MFNKIIKFFTRLMVLVAAISLVAMMLLTAFDVISRYFFNSPLSGTVELTEILMGFLVPLAIVYCAWKKEHIDVEIVFDLLPKPMRYASIILVVSVQLGLSIALTYQSFLLIGELMESTMGSPVLNLSYLPNGIAIACSFTFLALIYLQEILHTLLSGKQEAVS